MSRHKKRKKTRKHINKHKGCQHTRHKLNFKTIKRVLKNKRKMSKKRDGRKAHTMSKSGARGNTPPVHRTRAVASQIEKIGRCVDKVYKALARFSSSKSKVIWSYNQIRNKKNTGAHIPSNPEQWKELFNEDRFRVQNTDVLLENLTDRTNPGSIIYQAEEDAREILENGEKLKDKIGTNNNAREILGSVKAILDGNIDKNLYSVSGEVILGHAPLEKKTFNPALELLYNSTSNWAERISEMPPINVIYNFCYSPESTANFSTDETVPVLLGRLLKKIKYGILMLDSAEPDRPNVQMTQLHTSLCDNLAETIRILDKTTRFNEDLFYSLIPFLPAELFRASLLGAPSYQQYPSGDILTRDILDRDDEESKGEDDVVEESKSPEPAPVRRRLAFHDPDGTVLEQGSLDDAGDDDDCEWGSWPCMAERRLVGLEVLPTATSPVFDLSRFFTQLESGTLTIVDQMIAAVESLYNNHIVNEQSMSSQGSEPGPIHTFREEEGTSRLLPFTPVSNPAVVDYLGDEARLANDWIAYAVDWHYYKLIQYLYKYILIGKWNDEILRIVRDKNEEIWNYLESIGSGLGLRLRDVITQRVKEIADATLEPISVRLRLGSMLPENPENWPERAASEGILPGLGEQPGSYLDLSAGFMEQLRNVFYYLEEDVPRFLGDDVVDSMQTPLPRLSWLLWQTRSRRVDEESYQKWLRYCVNIEYYRLLMLIKLLWEMDLVENTTANEAYHFCEYELPDIMGYVPLHTNGFGMNGYEGVFGQLRWGSGE